MSFRLHWAVLVTLAILLLITPANAAPSLSLGSQANYKLTGFLKASQSCSANPAQYTPQACGFFIPPPNQTFLVIITDNGMCSSANTTACGFNPAFLSIPTGSSVQWVNNGTVAHTVTSNATLNGSLPPFDSLVISTGARYNHYFSVPGTYNYYDLIHPWMKAVLLVSGPPPQTPPPTSSSFRVDLGGNIGIGVIALNSDIANLKVDHKISVSISPVPGITFTPVTEQGSFEQKITLSTRVESPGTATSILRSLLRSVSQISGPRIYYGTLGPAQIYTGSVPVSSSVNSTSVSAFSVAPLVSNMIPALLQANGDPVYTIWWVNGPLSLGSPVQILTGSSSVTGDESLNLGGTLGTRDAWLVTSQFSQSVNATGPPPASSQSATSISLNLLSSFDKRGDLLLRSSSDLSVDTLSINNEQVTTANPCAPYGWCPTFTQVTVTRTMTANLNLSLRLASTSLNLDKRMMTADTPFTPLGVMASLAWLPFGVVGAGAAGLVGSSVWYVRRVRRKAVETGIVPQPQS